MNELKLNCSLNINEQIRHNHNYIIGCNYINNNRTIYS